MCYQEKEREGDARARFAGPWLFNTRFQSPKHPMKSLLPEPERKPAAPLSRRSDVGSRKDALEIVDEKLVRQILDIERRRHRNPFFLEKIDTGRETQHR